MSQIEKQISTLNVQIETCRRTALTCRHHSLEGVWHSDTLHSHANTSGGALRNSFSVTPSQPSPASPILLQVLFFWRHLLRHCRRPWHPQQQWKRPAHVYCIASLALLCRRTLCLADFGSLTLADSSSGRPHTGSSSHGSRPILELWSDTVMSYPHPWYYVSICVHVSGFWDVAVVEWLAKVPATWDVSRLCVLHGCSFIMSM